VFIVSGSETKAEIVDVAIFDGEERRQVEDPELFFQEEFAQHAVHLNPGDVCFSEDSEEMIVAMLGSGVFVSIYDVDLHIGAVAYVLLSEDIWAAFPQFDAVDPVVMGAAFAPIEDCLNEMKKHGAGKNRIRVCLVGGADVPDDEHDSGTKNYVFVREALKRKKLSIFHEDLGGEKMRRVHFFPNTGRIVKKVLRRESDVKIICAVERDFQKINTSGA
jgi:chemotaxis protein CheD